MKILLGLIITAFLVPAAFASTPDTRPMESVNQLSRKQRLALFEAQESRDLGNYYAAANVIRLFLEEEPDKDHYLLRFALGSDLASADRGPEALVHYKRCVELEPRFTQGWLNLGELAYREGEFETAANALERGYEQHEERPPNILYYAAVAHVLNGEPEAAVPLLQKLTSGEAGTPKLEWYQALVSAAIELEDTSVGEAAVASLLKWHPVDPDAWFLSFQYHASMADYHHAAVALTITGYLRPLTKAEMTQLGDLYTAIDVPIEATEYYAAAFGDTANAAEAERLASAYLAAHEDEKAFQTLQDELAEEPTPRLWSLLGDLHFMERQYQESYDAFKECAAMDETQGRAYIMMAYCAIELEDYDDAIAQLEKAVKLPDHEEQASTMLQRLKAMPQGRHL